MSDLRSGVLSQTQDILHYLGVSGTVLFKKPQKWTGELRTGQRKGHFHGLLRHRNCPTGESIQDSRPKDKSARDA